MKPRTIYLLEVTLAVAAAVALIVLGGRQGDLRPRLPLPWPWPR